MCIRDRQLLAGLAPCVEGAGDLCATEGTGRKCDSVLPGIRCAVSDGLVDDLVRALGQPVDVRSTGPVVPALDGVVEQPEDAVVVVRVVLRGVDSALCCDRVRSSGRVVVCAV